MARYWRNGRTLCVSGIIRGRVRLLEPTGGAMRSNSVWWMLRPRHSGLQIILADTFLKPGLSIKGEQPESLSMCCILMWAAPSARKGPEKDDNNLKPHGCRMENSGVHRILHHGNFTPLSCSQGSASCAGAEGRTLEDRHPRACTSLHVLETKYRLLFTLTIIEMHYKPIQSLTAEDH